MSRLLFLALVLSVAIAATHSDPVMAEKTAHSSAADTVLVLDQWTYKEVDNSRGAASFGLDMMDVTGDGYGDIVSGRYFYRSPGGNLNATWTRVTLPGDVDAVLFVNVDDDDRPDVIAQKSVSSDLNFYWLEATDASGSSWTTVTTIGDVPAASHSLGSQGHRIAQIEAGGKPEIVVTSGDGLYYFEIPASPAGGNWPVTHVNSNPTDEGFGVGDIDGDNHLDLASGTGGSKRVEWYKNPGDGSSGWTAYHIGDMAEATWTDRFAIADLDGDLNPDIVGTEENGSSSGAQTWWWEQPADPTSGSWTRREIVTQGSTNSMDTADMDNDGDVDVVLAEHKGTLKLAIWENDGSGNFTEHVVDTGKESHLGAQVTDLDGDGDNDIVSIAWNAYQFLHLWRNDALDELSPALLQNYSADYSEEAGGVVLTWRLADVGIDMKFIVLRADGPGSEYRELINPQIVGEDMAFRAVDSFTEPGSSYQYRLDVIDELGRRTLFETSAIEVPVLSMVLFQNYPNPFNPRTTIAYMVPRNGRVQISIYDANGRLVRQIVDSIQTSGEKSSTWDGRDSRGESVGSGIYFVRLDFEGRSTSRKITLLK